MDRRTLIPALALLLAGCTGGDGSDGGEKIRFDGCAHAHNDYEHDRPLLDANIDLVNADDLAGLQEFLHDETD